MLFQLDVISTQEAAEGRKEAEVEVPLPAEAASRVWKCWDMIGFSWCFNFRHFGGWLDTFLVGHHMKPEVEMICLKK